MDFILKSIVQLKQTMGSANTRQIEYSGEFEIGSTISSSEPPAIVGMIATSNGGIVICDKTSAKVKLLDDSFRPLSVVNLTSEPFGMVEVSDAVLVTLPELHLLQYIHVKDSKTLVAREKIQTDYKCGRILKYKRDLIVSAHEDKFVSLLVIDYSGQLVHCIRKESTESGGLLNRLGFIALSSDDTMICITEMCHGCIGLNVQTGEVMFTYKEPNCKFLFGLCTDVEGYVYMTCTDRDKIIMLDSSGRKLKQFAIKEGNNPGCMTFNQTHKKLYIKTVYTNKVYVYNVL